MVYALFMCVTFLGYISLISLRFSLIHPHKVTYPHLDKSYCSPELVTHGTLRTSLTCTTTSRLSNTLPLSVTITSIS